MHTLLVVHSVLRYAVFAVALAALIKFAIGQAKGATFGKADRVLGAAFVGLVDLQVTLGFVMVAMGTWYPALAGHLAMMLLAIALAHTLLIVNRRRANPGFLLPLLGVGGSLFLMVGGIFAIGRGLFRATAF